MGIFSEGSMEKETSTGAIIGYVLFGFAIVLAVAFLVFAGIKLATGDKDKETAEPVAVEQTVEIDTEAVDK